jgi:hypothetical protein
MRRIAKDVPLPVRTEWTEKRMVFVGLTIKKWQGNRQA